MKFWFGILINGLGWFIILNVSKVSIFSFDGAIITIGVILTGLGLDILNDRL